MLKKNSITDPSYLEIWLDYNKNQSTADILSSVFILKDFGKKLPKNCTNQLEKFVRELSKSQFFYILVAKTVLYIVVLNEDMAVFWMPFKKFMTGKMRKTQHDFQTLTVRVLARILNILAEHQSLNRFALVDKLKPLCLTLSTPNVGKDVVESVVKKIEFRNADEQESLTVLERFLVSEEEER